MKITDPGHDVLLSATQGNLSAIDQLLLTIQPGVFQLALRMLGQHEDAADATQEILLKVVTHLGSFRGEAGFGTWVWRIARNHLLAAGTRRRESPEVSLEDIAERLRQGLEFAARQALAHGEPGALTPEDKLEARETALACTQGMLMALNREQRLIYLMDTVFDLSSRAAADVLDITPEAYRQRLSRTRARLEGFMQQTCGLVSASARCRCDRQLPAIRATRAAGVTTNRPPDGQNAAETFDAYLRVTDAASVFRRHPVEQPPESMRKAIRAVLAQEGFLDPGQSH